MTLYRESHQRKAVLRYLLEQSHHPSAAQIHAALRNDLETLSLGTVYRNLEILEQQGRIRSLGLDPLETRYDAGLEPHGHFYCVRCHRIEDVFLKTGCCRMLNQLQRAGNRIHYLNLELIGICKPCDPKTKKPGAKKT